MTRDTSNFLAAIDATGTVRFVYKRSISDRAHGNFVQILTDGTNVFSNKDGKVLKVVQASGDVFEYFYDSVGNLQQVSLPGGSIWALSPSKVWIAVDETAMHSKPLNFCPSVDQDGVLWLKDQQGRSRRYNGECI